MSDSEFIDDPSKLSSKYLVDPSEVYQDDSDYDFEKTKVERTGRSEQVYNKFNYARIVAGCLVLNETHDKVMMISSSKHKDRWIFPKGGVELDEATNFKTTARRETWEEAGVIGKPHLRRLPAVEDHRFMKINDAKYVSEKIDLNIEGVKIPRSEFHFYEMQVSELCQEWPESNKRKRKWCTYEEAKHELHKSNRPELLKALNNSIIAKDCVKIKLDDHSNKLLDAQPETDDY